MKYTITIECEDEFDLDAITHAKANKLKLDCIYDIVNAYELVWEELSTYLDKARD